MELVSRCVECGLAEPESLASLGGSAPGVVDGILSRRQKKGRRDCCPCCTIDFGDEPLDDTEIFGDREANEDNNDDIIVKVADNNRSSLTTFLAVLLGAFRSLPALLWFAYYAAQHFITDFLYQHTFFLALRCLDVRRQKKGQRDCCPSWTVDLDEEPLEIFRFEKL